MPRTAPGRIDLLENCSVQGGSGRTSDEDAICSLCSRRGIERWRQALPARNLPPPNALGTCKWEGVRAHSCPERLDQLHLANVPGGGQELQMPPDEVMAAATMSPDTMCVSARGGGDIVVREGAAPQPSQLLRSWRSTRDVSLRPANQLTVTISMLCSNTVVIMDIQCQ